MAKSDINHAGGKFVWKGKNNLELTLEFENSADADSHIVEVVTEGDVTAKFPSLPSNWNQQTINWLSVFSVYDKVNNQKSGYATVPYEISIPFESGSTYFIYYDNELHDVTTELQNNKKVRLTKGDPAAGKVP
jgi:hypothetical protein